MHKVRTIITRFLCSKKRAVAPPVKKYQKNVNTNVHNGTGTTPTRYVYTPLYAPFMGYSGSWVIPATVKPLGKPVIYSTKFYTPIFFAGIHFHSEDTNSTSRHRKVDLS
jgi:hypothetical protein